MILTKGMLSQKEKLISSIPDLRLIDCDLEDHYFQRNFNVSFF
jgi:hypothetical protein